MLTAPALQEARPMSRLQYTAIFVCFLMNMLDGMDVMVISYTAPAIAKDWARLGISLAATNLGLVFSMGLLGMAIGAMFLAAQADVIGRRRMILLSAVLMGSCVLATQYVQSVPMLVLARFISGLGIGSMLASTATMTAEYAPARTKDFWVSFAMSGYPIGAVLSGMVAARIIPVYGWQSMFLAAGVATLLTVPLSYFFLAESLDFLLKSRPKNALVQANRILHKMGEKPLPALPTVETSVTKAAVRALFVGHRRSATLLLWGALFMSFATLYFLTMWIPKLASNAGLALNLAIYAGTVFNLGAFFGIISQGYLSAQFGLKRVISGFLVATALLMTGFGWVNGSVWVLVFFGLIGFGVQGGFVGMYSLAARLYPTRIRATGVGWAVGAGRIGAVVGPLVGGLLIGAGWPMSASFVAFAVPALIAALVTLFIRVPDQL
ncbi:MFS transporter [Fibrella aquatilis]|uniref:MFS transporter n=1 Tax=Fibrella aquatilis TaxID=2817059 RepID=A0A939G525_9BACT|nr:MFS transporter [Fibrella aquatilis]MBO0931333.1 MFS transporter [Fibrella aquatilis]